MPVPTGGAQGSVATQSFAESDGQVIIGSAGGSKLRLIVILVIIIAILGGGTFAVYKIKPDVLPAVIRTKLDSWLGGGKDSSPAPAPEKKTEAGDESGKNE